MALIDVRSPLAFDTVNRLLLRVAEKPLEYVDEVAAAARLGRQASATIVSNCVSEIWSVTVSRLLALEPDFPLYPTSVTEFAREVHLPFLSFVTLYYFLCGKRDFRG